MLRLDHICWSAPDGRTILDDLSCTIPEGKLIAVTGPNGSGKTTLARLIVGIEQPSSGQIMLDELDLTGLDVTERANRGISFAFQQPVRFKGLTVRQLIEIAAGRALTGQGLCDILSGVGLCANEYLDREVNATLSGGEMKRIEIATVLARHTRLSIFDEPEAGIDLWSFANLIQVFQTMRRNLQGALIIISHQERILRIADEIILLDSGKIRASGAPDRMLLQVMCGESAVHACHKQEAIFNE